MTPVPLNLPLRAADAAELGHLIFEHAEKRPLTQEGRNRLASRAAILRLESVTPYFGSLVRDPVHPSTYYLAADGHPAEGESSALLLHLAPATAPTSSVFHKPVLIGRMRSADGREVVINAIPFGPCLLSVPETATPLPKGPLYCELTAPPGDMAERILAAAESFTV